MYLRGRSAYFLFGLFCAFFLLLIAIHTQYSDAASAPVRRAATNDDLKWLEWSGIPNPTVGMTISPDDPFSGQTQSEAKMWLAQHTTLDRSRITCLNPQFAVKLKAFLEKVPGGPPKITGAYRTINEQKAAMNSGASKVKNACSGYHLYGLAIDVNDANKQQLEWMRANARGDDIATIGNPTTGCFSSGFCDPAHFQDIGSRVGQCGACAAGGVGDVSTGGGGGAGVGSSNPISAFTGTLRQLFNPQQQPQQQPVSQQPLSQSPLDSYTGQNTTSSNINTNVNQNTSTTSSAADLLEDLAFGSSNIATSTTMGTSSVPLVVSGKDAVVITSSQNQSGQQNTGTGASSPSQQTFISGDLSWQDGSNVGPPLTGWQAILATIKATLVRILVYLKPFGGEEYLDGRLE